MKQAISVIATLLVFVSYIPYLRDMLKKKTKPHVYTWFIWGFINLIIFFLQLSDGAGLGALVTLSAVIPCLFIFGLGLKIGDKDITTSDTIFLATALFATSLWLFAKQPVASITLLTAIDILGFIPTVRKSWSKPYQETLFTWQLNGFRFLLAIFALQSFTYVTMLYPVSWAAANIGFSLLLIIRRGQLKKSL